MTPRRPSVPGEPAASDVIRELKRHRNPAQAKGLRRFFKTGPGAYGEGDQFWGIKVPQIRSVVASFPGLPLTAVDVLLSSPVHELRFCGVAALVREYAHASPGGRHAIYEFYLSRSHRVNNWDLVDVSAPGIVGRHLPPGKGRRTLGRLVASPLLWDRRIAMVSTLTHLRQGALDNTFWLAGQLLEDPEDLMHKATGWMLREAGQRDEASLDRFLNQHAARMPRIMLRDAIEKYPPEARRFWLTSSRRTP
jgi:3-methyladenine DNA glycosylase AlkD